MTDAWQEELSLSDLVRDRINNDPKLLSLLYDLDLLPEQLLSQGEKTPGLIKAYHRLYGIMYAYFAFVYQSPASGFEIPKGPGSQSTAEGESPPLTEGDAPIPLPQDHHDRSGTGSDRMEERRDG